VTQGTEPLTIDFKETATPRIAECAAAMANTFGGLIFVGVTDQNREVVGVPREIIGQVAGYLTTRLDPADWQPETFEVPLGDESPGRYVIVVRVNRDQAPRPVFVEAAARFSKERRNLFLAPVRIPGGTRQATRDELEALFIERQAEDVQDTQWDLNAPDIPYGDAGGRDPTVDLLIRSGLRVPVGRAAWGRPISQRAVDELAGGLSQSALAGFVLELTWRGNTGVGLFRREGHNRSHTANLVWRLLPGEPVPFEMTARVEVPGHYGQAQVGAVELSLTIVSRFTAWLNAGRSSEPPPSAMRRLEIQEWAALLDSIPATLTNPEVVSPIADLAGVDPIEIGQPRVLHVRSGPQMPDLLPAELRPIPDTGASYGAHMLADPALDLSDPNERSEQVDLWLNQMCADAGLMGMEELVADMRHGRPPD